MVHEKQRRKKVRISRLCDIVTATIRMDSETKLNDAGMAKGESHNVNLISKVCRLEEKNRRQP